MYWNQIVYMGITGPSSKRGGETHTCFGESLVAIVAQTAQ